MGGRKVGGEVLRHYCKMGSKVEGDVLYVVYWCTGDKIIGMKLKKKNRLRYGAGFSDFMTSHGSSFLAIIINTGFQIYNVQKSFRLKEVFHKSFNKGSNASSWEQKGKQKSQSSHETSLELVSWQVDFEFYCFNFFL